LDLDGQDPSEGSVRFDQKEVIRRLHVEPLMQPCAHSGKRNSCLAGRAKQVRNHLIERQSRRSRNVRFALPYVEAATVAELDPTLAFQLAIAGAYGIGMQTKSSGQFAGAGQSLSRAEVVAENGQNDLRHQLSPDRNCVPTGEPELHAGPS